MRLRALKAALLGLALCAAWPAGMAHADTPLGGEINADRTLTAAGSPYLVTSDVFVRNGALLAVQPGVTIKVGAGSSIIVESGALRAIGTPLARILITSAGSAPAPGDWGYLRFLDGTNDALTRLEQVDVRFGTEITLQSAAVAIESTDIQFMSGAAIEIDLASSPTGSNDSASNNGLNAIKVAAGEMTQRGTWGVRGIPFVLQGRVTIGRAPSITGITPLTVEDDSTTSASIAGVRLDGSRSVTFAGTGVTGQILLGGTATAVPILVTVAPGTALGNRTFDVDAAAGLVDSGAVVLRVVPAKPVIQTLDPALIAQGSPDTTVTINGRHFVSGSVARFEGTDLETHFQSATQLTAVVPAARLTALGLFNITVANPDPENPGQFLVSAPSTLTVSRPPQINSITPSAGALGATVFASIGGTDLLGATAVVFGGTGVSATIQPGGTATNLPIRIDINAAAPTGARTFDVVSPSGTGHSGAVVFTVTVPVPSIGSINPNVGIRGSTGLIVTVAGSGFIPESIVQFNGADRTTGVTDSTHRTVSLTTADLASLGTFPIRVVNPDAANPGLAQNSNSVSFQVVQPFLSLAPTPVNVQALKSAILTFTLSIPAPPGGTNVTLTPFQPLVATVNGGTTATLLVLEGATQGTATVEGVILNGGSTTINATAGGFTSASVTVNVAAAPRINLTPPTLLVGVGRTAQITVASTVVAGVGGIPVTLVQSQPGLVSAPASVVIPEGASSLPVTISGTAAGLLNLSGSSPGFATGTSTDVTVQQASIVLPGSIFVSPGLTRPFSVLLTEPAPTGGTTINFDSSNTIAADPPAPIVILEGFSSGIGSITGKSAGTATITATDPSGIFHFATMTALVQAVNITIAPASGSTFKGPTYGTRPSVFINAAAPIGGQVINLASSNTSVATVPPSVTVLEGQTSAQIVVIGVGAGTAVITPSAPGLNTTGTFAVTVVDTRLDIGRNIGNYGLRSLTGARNGNVRISLDSAAPTAVNLTVSVEGGAGLVAPYNTPTPPASTMLLPIPAGSSFVDLDLVGVLPVDFTDLNTPYGVSLNAAGDLLIADRGNLRVRRVVGATGVIQTIAGTTSGFSGDGADATLAQLSNPSGAVFDSAGGALIADQSNHRIRRVDPATGFITTVAGNPAYSCSQPRDGNAATDAGLCNPTGLFLDPVSGALYFADQSFQRVRRIDPGSDGLVNGVGNETITTVAGSGTAGFGGDGARATLASLNTPTAVTINPLDGSLFFTDQGNHVVRRVTAGSDGQVKGAADEIITTVAGGVASCSTPADGQPATNAGLCSPSGLAFDSLHRLYISDTSFHRIRRVSTGADTAITGASDEIISTVAGTGSCTFSGNGRSAATADLCNPRGIAIDGLDNLFIADASNHQIRKVSTATGIISTVAGSGEAGLKGDGGSATGLRMLVTAPDFISNDAPIQIFASRLQFNGILTTLNTLSAPDTFTVRMGADALGYGFRVAQPMIIDLTSSNPGAVAVTASVTIADNGTGSATATETVAGTGSSTVTASVSPTTPPFGPIDGASTVVVVSPALLGVNSDPLSPNSDSRVSTGTGMRNGQYQAIISGPAPTGGVTAHLTVADPSTALLAPYNTTTAGTASLDLVIPAGSRTSAGFDLIGVGLSSAVLLNNPIAVAFDAPGNLFFADLSNHRVRRVDVATGVLSTVAGDGTTTFSGDGGPANLASLQSPQGLTLDASGNLFIADTSHHRIRRVDHVTGVITTVAGNATYSCSQTRDGGAATDAGLCNPVGLTFDAAGALLIGDQSFCRVRRVVPGADGLITAGADAANEVITTVAGTGSCSYNGDARTATSATLSSPIGVAVDSTGALFIADMSNARIRRVGPGTNGVVEGGADGANELITTVVGTGTATFGGDGGAATAASINAPWGLSIDAAGELLIADRGNQRIRKVVPGANAGITGDSDETITTIAGTGTAGYNGDGQAATLANVYNAGQAIQGPGSSGDIYIADESIQRIRRIEGATGIIRTEVGSGPAGFGGDGSSGKGVRITATAPGFNSNDAQVQVYPSNLAISGLETTRNTLSATDAFTVFLQTPNVGNLRTATPLTIDLTTSNAGVEAFQPGNTAVTTVAIANNANNSSTATLGVVGTGNTTITAAVSATTPPAGAIIGASGSVTINPATLGVNSDPLGPSSDSRVNTGTGMRNGSYEAIISGPAPTGGVTAHLTVADPSKALLAPYNTTTAGTATLDLVIPAGSRSSASFDLIGVSLTNAVLLNNPLGVAFDASGNLFIADTSNHRVRRVDAATGILTTVAGDGTTTFSGDGGPGTLASLQNPEGLAVDAAGNLFIADTSHHRIRRVDHVTGVITTVAGNASYSCSQVRDGSAATDAGLCNPVGLAFDAAGALLIGDQSFCRVRRVVPGSDALVTAGADATNELISTVAGTGSCSYNGDARTATSATLSSPIGVVVDATGALFIADQSNERIRRVAPGGNGVVEGGADAANELITTVAGTGTATFGGDGGAATSASINAPWNLSIDAAGDLLIADRGNHRLRKVVPGATAGVTGDSDETITTIAGTGAAGFNGDGQAATLANLYNVGQAIEVPGGSGDIFIADESTHRIRRIEGATGIIRTEVGSGPAGFAGDGTSAHGVRITATASGFNSNDAVVQVYPSNLAISGLETTRNTLSATDAFTVFLQTPSVSNLRAAGPLTIDVTTSNSGVEAFQPGNTTSTTVAIANNANNSSTATLGVVGAGTTTIAAAVSATTPPVGAITGASGGVTINKATLGVNSDPLSVNGDSRLSTGTGARTGQYQVYISGPAPTGGVTAHLTVADPSKALLAPYNTTSSGSATLDLVIPAGSRTSAGFDVIGVSASNAVLLNNPLGVVFDAAGNLFIADTSNHRVRRLDAATGMMTTVAGDGTTTFSGDDGPATSASLQNPEALAVDAAGNLFIADTSHHRIRRVDHVTGVITTVAGNASFSCSQVRDGSPANNAGLCNPVGLAFDAAGALLIGDQSFCRIRRVVPGTDALVAAGADAANELISTVAGTGSCGYNGDARTATSATISSPIGVTVDSTGALFIADSGNARIRRVAPGANGVVEGGTDAANELITTVAGTGTAAFGGDGGAATAALINAPWNLSIDTAGDLLIADRGNHRIRKVIPGATAGVMGDGDETITTIAGTGTVGYNGDGQVATLANLYNVGQAVQVPGGSGDILIADESTHRIRRVEAATGIMRTEIGNGVAGFAGDGSTARGVRVTATAPGFDSNDASVDSRQSSFRVTPAATTISTLSTTFTVGIEPAGLGCCSRAAAPTSITVEASDPTVLTPTTPVSIPNNTTTTGTQALPTAGAGTSTLVASTLGAAINPGVSALITVLPTVTSLVPAAGQQGTVVPATLNGTNLVNASSITVSGTGVSVTVGTRTNTALSLSINIDALAETGTRTMTIVTPGGNATIGFVVTSAAVTSVRLTDACQFAANASGQSTNTFIHDTIQNANFQLGLTTPQVSLPSGSAVSFVNPGNTDINLPLALGSNTFTMVGDSTTTASPFGLNLFFNDEIIPGISVYNTNGGTGAFSVQAPETSTSGNATGGAATVPASGATSIATDDGYAVTLTAYTMRSVTSPFVDLAGGQNIGVANGTADTVGVSMVLNVTQPGNMTAFAVLGGTPPVGFTSLAPDRTTISFDESPFPDSSANPALGTGVRGVEIANQYSSLGVSFGTAAGNIQTFVFGQFTGMTTGKVLGNNNFSFQGPAAANFPQPRAAVGVVVTDGDASVGAATLTAYSGPNGTGTALGIARSPGGTGNDPYFLGLVDTSGTPRIKSVVIRFQRITGSDLVMDDFTFSRTSP